MVIADIDRNISTMWNRVATRDRLCKEERREAELGNLKELTFLYFDGKKTMTRVLAKTNETGRWSPTIKVDNHYVVLTEPSI